MRRVVLALVLAFLTLPAPAHASTWVRPVPGPVVRRFDPPKTRYGPGHLGVDFAAAPGTFVRASGPGTVAFAGQVAGGLHVVIRHPNGWRTSYSFLATVHVRRDQQVVAGDLLGTTGGRGENHDGSVLHLGLRIGDEYVDPMQLFATMGPATVRTVHLAPVGEAPRAPSERMALGAGLPPADYPLMSP